MKTEKEIKEYLYNLKTWALHVNEEYYPVYYPVSTAVTIKTLEWVLNE